ncbi:MAG: hypothetical protein J5519_00815 [Bacteroidales bacterium]|nr:hypothetical protein [Bacteroidales bacterium]
MKRSTWLILLLAGALALPAACNKEELQATYNKQETNIANFIAAAQKKDSTATVTITEGVYRITQHDTLNLPDSLLWGGKVTLRYACYVLNSSSVSAKDLVATNVRSVASAAGWALTDTTQFQPTTLTLDKTLLDGLRLGLYGVQEKDEAYILFNGKFGFGDHIQGTIPARSALAYHIWIDSIENE